ncbi:hypothetical protein CP980_34365 [Streptomyces vinaceus]|uniref:PE-PGRS family protein n=1 Tax=Streptomyces vinaceus TaxID=1960 RepID=A0A5J6JPM8_STRVI|nr:hypothetical protein [Streptomyces vinaceus]QEV49458.1 hypothetical protein CP980_34365 [Streptomyces vinaceus]GHE45694.1 hypothetical protein GCM10017778_31810 [Streptomyces vinaceus]
MSDVGGDFLRACDVDDGLVQEWFGGLMWNPGLTGSVLARLLTVEGLPRPASWITICSLDKEKTAVLAASPQVEHRLWLIENGNADVDVLAAFARDPDPRVRTFYATFAGDFGRRIPAGVVEALAEDSEVRVRRRATQWEMPTAVRARLAEDRDAGVRAAALTPALWPCLPASVQERLLADPEPKVRAALAKMFPDEPKDQLDTPPTETRIQDPDPAVRRAAAEDPRVPTELALELSQDPDDAVRLALSMREDLTEAQRSAITYVVPHGYHTPPRWIVESGHEPEVARRAATSEHVLLRRSIAMQQHLPDDVVKRLASDEDFFVKLTLCQYGDKAPHDLVVEMYAHWHGLTWSNLRFHPNFAKPGLARYADHPNPRLRHAALDDPDGGPDLVMQLIDDPEVGPWALRDPRLPSGELLRRLALPGSARHAAANPALSPAEMHRLLDLAGVTSPPDPR